MKSAEDNRRSDLDALKSLTEEELDLSEMPEIPAWDDAVQGKFYKPVKKAISLRVDADILAWLKSAGGHYQTRINQVLRDYMNASRDQNEERGSPGQVKE
jgi:uncharacterized protein (DUF4415 family)